ncbi:MAG: ABC transporter permease [Candidatus Omnitrophota bacterium]
MKALKNLFLRLHKTVFRYNRYLLVELTRASFKVHDYNSALGLSWSLISPCLIFLVLYIIFNIHFSQSMRFYPLYLLLGVIVTNFFVTAPSYMLRVFYDNREIVLNSTIPREYLILSGMAIHLYKFLIEMGIIWIVSIFCGLFKFSSFLLFFPLLALYVGMVLGICFALASFYCLIRDVEHMWMMFSRLFFFVTPVFYTLEGIRPLARAMVYWLNPLTPFLVSFRELIIGTTAPDMLVYGHSVLLGLLFFFLGYGAFIFFEDAAMENA